MRKTNDRTRVLLLEHQKQYPKAEIRDVFKFLYQSAFGCEHAVSSAQTAVERIEKEYSGIPCDQRMDVQPLDGAYSRVSLGILNKGMRAETLANLFVTSAKREVNGKCVLREKLEVAITLVRERLLPFSEEEFIEAVSKWENDGFPAVRHSEVFRQQYHPAYRVISNAYIPFLPLFATLDKLLETGMVCLAVEGGSASGKTTLGNLLGTLYDCTLLHMDDFFLQPAQRTPERFTQVGGNVDYERFFDEVVSPFKRGETIAYRRFDCGSMSIQAPQMIVPKRLTVVEGAYSTHPAFGKYYDVAVFLDVSPQLQKARIEKRNTPAFAKRFWEEWIPMERVYFRKTNVKARCDMVISIVE